MNNDIELYSYSQRLQDGVDEIDIHVEGGDEANRVIKEERPQLQEEDLRICRKKKKNYSTKNCNYNQV